MTPGTRGGSGVRSDALFAHWIQKEMPHIRPRENPILPNRVNEETRHHSQSDLLGNITNFHSKQGEIKGTRDSEEQDADDWQRKQRDPSKNQCTSSPTSAQSENPGSDENPEDTKVDVYPAVHQRYDYLNNGRHSPQDKENCHDLEGKWKFRVHACVK